MNTRYWQCLSLVSLLSIAIMPVVHAINPPYIESIEGEASIQSVRRRPIPAREGGSLGADDVILIERGNRIRIYCVSGDIPVLGHGDSPIHVRNVCDFSRLISRPSCARLAEHIGGKDSTIPYVITPRGDFIANDDVILRWNPVENASEYTIRIESQESLLTNTRNLVWETTTSDTKIVYPNNPQLVPNLIYTVVVEAKFDGEPNTIVSSEQEGIDTFFRVLSQEDADQLQTEIADVLAQDISIEVQALELLRVYTCRAATLTSEAINALEKIASQQEGGVSIHRLLGDLYYNSGLMQLAQQHYQNVTESAHLFADVEEWTKAQIGLSNVYQSIANSQAAVQHLYRANLAAFYFCDQQALENIAAALTSITGEETEPMACTLNQD